MKKAEYLSSLIKVTKSWRNSTRQSIRSPRTAPSNGSYLCEGCGSESVFRRKLLTRTESVSNLSVTLPGIHILGNSCRHQRTAKAWWPKFSDRQSITSTESSNLCSWRASVAPAETTECATINAAAVIRLTAQCGGSPPHTMVVVARVGRQHRRPSTSLPQRWREDNRFGRSWIPPCGR